MGKKQGGGLVDLLVGMMSPERKIVGSGSGGSVGMNPDVPVMPQMQQGMGVGNAIGLDPATLQRIYPIWQAQHIDAQVNGSPFPQFNDWLATQDIAALMR